MSKELSGTTISFVVEFKGAIIPPDSDFEFAATDIAENMTCKTDSFPANRNSLQHHSLQQRMVGFVVILLFGLATGLTSAAEGFPGSNPITVKLRSGKKTTIGRLVEFNSFRAIVLRRDGRMVEFRRSQIDELKQIQTFTPYSPLKLQDHYQKMFGTQYEVSRTRHYVVVHPKGMRQQWAVPFDELYNRFTYYFSVRGFTLKPAEFPMVVVVFNSRSEFNKVAAKDGINNPNSFAGYYSSESNWIVTYRNSSKNRSGNWEDNEILIHEALHQFAFNHGIHQRWAPTPQWCAEGLASMFEAKGINNARVFRNAKDEINPVYLQLLIKAIDQQKVQGRLKQLVATDRIFDENIALAYALSWGLSYYLAETQPSKFNAYLQRIAARDRTDNYTASDRIADFGQSFGTEFAMLESHFTKFVKGL